MRELTIGAFYWVRLAIGDERNAEVPKTEWQPAKYTGRAADSVGDTWDFIGQRSDDGHHFVDVLEVGVPVERDAMIQECADVVGNMRQSEAGLFDAEHSGQRGEDRSNALFAAYSGIVALKAKR